MNIMPGAPQTLESAKSQKQFIIKKQRGNSKQRANSKKASLVKAYLPNLMPKNGGGGGGEMTLVTPTNVAQAHISGPGGGQPPLQPNMR